jgi:hypothetical protein
MFPDFDWWLDCLSLHDTQFSNRLNFVAQESPFEMPSKIRSSHRNCHRWQSETLEARQGGRVGCSRSRYDSLQSKKPSHPKIVSGFDFGTATKESITVATEVAIMIFGWLNFLKDRNMDANMNAILARWGFRPIDSNGACG